MNNLASGYQAAGQLDRALPLLEETLALQKAKLGPDHPDTLTSMNNLAIGYQAAGQLDRALPLFEETLALQKAKLGPDHPDTLDSLEQPSPTAWLNSGQLDRAWRSVDEVHRARDERPRANGHPATFTVPDSTRADLDLARGRLDAAEAADRAILDGVPGAARRRRPGSRSPPGSPWPGCEAERGDRNSAATLSPDRA